MTRHEKSPAASSPLGDGDLLERIETYFAGPENLLLALRSRLADRLEALELADATLRGANMNRNVVERKIRAALNPGAAASTPICRCSEEARNNRLAARMGAELANVRSEA